MVGLGGDQKKDVERESMRVCVQNQTKYRGKWDVFRDYTWSVLIWQVKAYQIKIADQEDYLIV